jgi:hypothetical protein
VPADSTIDIDLPCSGCGYNLRGLPLGGSCPECGQQVADTFSSARGWSGWFIRVSQGSLLIGGGFLAGGLAVGAAALVPVLLLTLPLATLISAFGAWRLATPSPGFSQYMSPRLGTAVRAATLTICAFQNTLLASLFLNVRETELASMLSPMFVVWSVAAALTFAHTGMLARHASDRAGLVQAAILGALNAGMLLFPVVVSPDLPVWDRIGPAFVIVVLVTSIWTTIFFIGFGIMLRRRAKMSGRDTIAGVDLRFA